MPGWTCIDCDEEGRKNRIDEGTSRRGSLADGLLATGRAAPVSRVLVLEKLCASGVHACV
jgi:hypothetical protein